MSFKTILKWVTSPFQSYKNYKLRKEFDERYFWLVERYETIASDLYEQHEINEELKIFSDFEDVLHKEQEIWEEFDIQVANLEAEYSHVLKDQNE
jgi:hypothetical protein